MLAGDTRPHTDVMIARLPNTDMVFLGIRHAARVRLTLEQARQLAGGLLEISDPDYAPPAPPAG